MLCSHCGKEIDNDSYACKYCGGIVGSQLTVELNVKLDEEKEKPQWKIIVPIFAVVLAVAIVFSIVAISFYRKSESKKGYADHFNESMGERITVEEATEEVAESTDFDVFSDVTEKEDDDKPSSEKNKKPKEDRTTKKTGNAIKPNNKRPETTTKPQTTTTEWWGDMMTEGVNEKPTSHHNTDIYNEPDTTRSQEELISQLIDRLNQTEK